MYFNSGAKPDCYEAMARSMELEMELYDKPYNPANPRRPEHKKRAQAHKERYLDQLAKGNIAYCKPTKKLGQDYTSVDKNPKDRKIY